MRIPKALLEEMIAHALEDAPDECCGIVGSAGGEAVKVFRTENTAHSPLRYIMDGREQLAVQDEIDDNDWELGAIYHSHTRSDPVPSQTDVNLAKLGDLPRFPGTLYIIVGVKDRMAPDVRAWDIVMDEVTQVELEVV